MQLNISLIITKGRNTVTLEQMTAKKTGFPVRIQMIKLDF